MTRDHPPARVRPESSASGAPYLSTTGVGCAIPEMARRIPAVQVTAGCRAPFTTH